MRGCVRELPSSPHRPTERLPAGFANSRRVTTRIEEEERATGFEPVTLSLEGSCATATPRPRNRPSIIGSAPSGPSPAEDERVGRELAVVEIGVRGPPPDADADVAKVGVEHVAAIEVAVQPAANHLAGGVVVAEVLREAPRLLPLRVAGPSSAGG